jgi:hypothetical protein
MRNMMIAARELSKCVKVSISLAKDVHRVCQSRVLRRMPIRRVFLYAIIEQFADIAGLSLKPLFATERINLLRQLKGEIREIEQ